MWSLQHPSLTIYQARPLSLPLLNLHELCSQAYDLTQASWQCLNLGTAYHFQLLQTSRCCNAVRKAYKIYAEDYNEFPEVLEAGDAVRKAHEILAKKESQLPEALKAGD